MHLRRTGNLILVSIILFFCHTLLWGQDYVLPSGMKLFIDADDEVPFVELRLMIDKRQWRDNPQKLLMAEFYAQHWRNNILSEFRLTKFHHHGIRFLPGNPVHWMDLSMVNIRIEKESFAKHQNEVFKAISRFNISNNRINNLKLLLDDFEADSLLWQKRHLYAVLDRWLQNPGDSLNHNRLTREDVLDKTSIVLYGNIDKISILNWFSELRKRRSSPIGVIDAPGQKLTNRIDYNNSGDILLSISTPPVTVNGILARCLLIDKIKMFITNLNIAGMYRKYVPWNSQWDYLHIRIHAKNLRNRVTPEAWTQFQKDLRQISKSEIERWYYTKWLKHIETIAKDHQARMVRRHLSYFYFNDPDVLFQVYLPGQLALNEIQSELQAMVEHKTIFRNVE